MHKYWIYGIAAVIGGLVGYGVATVILDTYPFTDEFAEENALLEIELDKYRSLDVNGSDVRELKSVLETAVQNHKGIGAPVAKAKPVTDYSKMQKVSLEELAMKYRVEAKIDESKEVADISEKEDEPIVFDRPTEGWNFITEDTYYLDEADEFEKFQFNYYTGDKVAVDAQNIIIKNVPGEIGESALKRIMASSDLDVIYVRNWNLERDYEVTVIHGSFVDMGVGSEDLLGVDSDEDDDEEEDDERD